MAINRAASLAASWSTTPFSGSRGGTGVNNGTKTITLGGNLSTAGALTVAGAYAGTLNLAGATNITLPTSGTILPVLTKANAPTDYTAISGLIAWFRAGYGSTQAVGQPGAWVDLSGNGYITTPQGKGPTLVASAVNGLPAWQFSGAGWMDLPFIASVASPQTIFLVAAFGPNVASQAEYLFDGRASGTRVGATSDVNGGTGTHYNDFGIYSGSVIYYNSSGWANTWHLFELTFGTSGSIIIDKVSQVTGSTGTRAITELRFGGDFGSGTGGAVGNLLDGKIAEILIFSGSLSSGDRTTIRNAVSAQYGIF